MVQFVPDDLATIQAGDKEVDAGKLFFDLPARLIERLERLWRSRDALGATGRAWYDVPAPPESSPDYLPPLKAEEPLSERAPWYIGMTDEFLKAVRAIDRKLQGRILEAIGHLSRKPTEPLGDTIKPLTGELKGLWRYRLGDYRIVYRPDSERRNLVLVAFTVRGEAYQ